MPVKTPVLAVDEPLEATEPATTAELSECTCPEFCERDHDLD